MEDRKQTEKIITMIKEYDERTFKEKKTDEKIEEVIKLIFDICKKLKCNPVEKLELCCINANVGFPEELRFFKMEAFKNFRKIKKGDTLIFNRVDTELEDQGFYFFTFEFDGECLENYGIYNKNTNTMETDMLQFDMEDITILGKLFQVEREL